MSWFEYGKPDSRSLRRNVHLRPHDLPARLLKRARKLMRKDEELHMVIVSEIRPNRQVLLEFWSRDPFVDPTNRFTVFHLLENEDPGWICEGDVGRGYKENRKKK